MTELGRMKPVGRKRDLQIGKYKGFTEDWSTNRNKAWELWDELDEKCFQIFFSKSDKGYCLDVLFRSKIEGGHIQSHGKDFADCVSQAWITWKEGDKG